MSKFQIGEYINYKGKPHIVVTLTGEDGRVTLHPGDTNKKVRVGIHNAALSKVFRIAKVVNYQSRRYIVTKHGIIISVTTGKLCKWETGSKQRNEILSLGDIE